MQSCEDLVYLVICDVLCGRVDESLALNGEAMTTSAMAAYAYGQIEGARAELEQLR
jgi:hypothetical protein